MKKILLRLCILCFLLCHAYTGFAFLTPTIHSTASGGEWSNPGTWIEGRVPTESDIVEINGLVEILQSTTTIQALSVTNEGKLQPKENIQNVDDRYRTLTVNGDIENFGTIEKEKSLRDPNLPPDPNFPANPQLEINSYGNIKNNGQLSCLVSIFGEQAKTVNGTFPVNINLMTNITLQGGVYIGNLVLDNHTLTVDTSNTIILGTISSGGKINDISGNPDGKIYIMNIYYPIYPVVINVPVVEMNGTFSTYDVKAQFKKLLLVGNGIINGPLYADSVDIYGDYQNNDIGGDHTIFADTTLKSTGNLTLSYMYITNNFDSGKLFIIDGVFTNEGTVEAIFNFAIPFTPLLDIGVTKGIKNTGTITAKVGAVWSQINQASSYKLTFDGYQPITVTDSYYDITNLISNSLLTWTVEALGVVETQLPTPTNLTQWIEMPDPDNHSHLPREEIGSGKELGAKIGHFQAGTGVLFDEFISNPEGREILVRLEVYGSGQVVGVDSPKVNKVSITGVLSGAYEITVPISELPAGEYRWRIRTEDTEGNASDWVEFGNNGDEMDFAIFDGFEPYPYGYKFENSNAVGTLLTGGIKGHKIDLGGNVLYDSREKIDGYKWELFYSAFDTSNLIKWNNGVLDDTKLLDAFESRGLNKVNPEDLSNGTCYGLGLSSVMKFAHPDYLQTYFSGVWDTIGLQNTWDVERLGSSGSILWDRDTPILKSLLSLHLSQFSFIGQKAQNDALQYKPLDVLEVLKNNPDKHYLLGITGTGASGKLVGHLVVPYKVERNRIYISDSNIPFPDQTDKNGNKLNAYQQFIQVSSNSNWYSSFYKNVKGRKGFGDLLLIDVDTLYNNNQKSHVIGFNGNDIAYSFSGGINAYLKDELGRISGYIDNQIYNQIPGVNVAYGFNETLSGSSDNTFKQLYLPQKMEGLILHIEGKTNEKYTLMIAGGDYYQKLEGVSTSSGQTDTFTATGTGLTINFDDIKTGTYSLLVDNFHDYGTTNTGTVYIDSVNVIPQSQQYTIDWDKVVQNTNDATQHTVDTNNDGVIGDIGDSTTNLPPIYQDITSPTTTVTLTGTLVPNSTGSYYDTATVNLNASDNTNGSGVDKTYYSINTGALLTYTGSITLTQTGIYTLNYYSVDKFNNQEPPKTLTFSVIQTPTPTIPTYTFPTQTIPRNSGQQTAISSRYTVVGNVSGYTRGQNIAFTTGGQGNPTVQTTSGNRATSGNFQGGLNVQMNVPPRGETYTGYVDIQGLRLIFSTKRDSAPPSDVGTLDFGTKTVNYAGTVVSNRVTFPFLPDPTPFTLTGTGNPTVQTSNGTRNSTGTVNWGTNIQAEIPPVGQTRVIEFTILGKTGKFTIKRQ